MPNKQQDPLAGVAAAEPTGQPVGEAVAGTASSMQPGATGRCFSLVSQDSGTWWVAAHPVGMPGVPDGQPVAEGLLEAVTGAAKLFVSVTESGLSTAENLMCMLTTVTNAVDQAQAQFLHLTEGDGLVAEARALVRQLGQTAVGALIPAEFHKEAADLFESADKVLRMTPGAVQSQTAPLPVAEDPITAQPQKAVTNTDQPIISANTDIIAVSFDPIILGVKPVADMQAAYQGFLDGKAKHSKEPMGPITQVTQQVQDNIVDPVRVLTEPMAQFASDMLRQLTIAQVRQCQASIALCASYKPCKAVLSGQVLMTQHASHSCARHACLHTQPLVLHSVTALHELNITMILLLLLLPADL